MRAAVITTMLITIVFCSTIASAQDCREAIEVRNPCVGILLPTGAATEALACLEIDVPRLELKLKEEKEKCGVRIKSLSLELKLEREHSAELKGLLEKALEVADTGVVAPEAWWDQGWLKYTLGVASGIALTLGVLYARIKIEEN